MNAPARQPDLVRLGRGEEIEVATEGGSMFPFVRNGAVVIVGPIDRELRIGDLVLAVVSTRWVLHRIVELDGERVVLRGDNMLRTDPPIRRAQVQGLALAVRVRGRRMPLGWPAALSRAWVQFAPMVARGVRLAERARRLSPR